MVEKIPVRPESVRGLGNIISPAKTLEDFSVFNSKLSYVDGFYTMEYVSNVSVTLTSDKSILSYADGDSATLTVTVLEDSSAVSGETVEFYRYVDGTNDVLLGSDVTDSNGEATYSYASASIGDVGLYAKVRTFVSKTYEIQDCNYADNNTYTSEVSKNISLPSTFKLEFDLYPKSRSTNSGGVAHYIKMTRTGTTDIWVGQGTSSGSHGIMVRPSTNYWCTSLTSLNTENHVVVTYDGTTLTYTCNNESKSVSTTSLSTISGLASTSNGNIKNVKVKPL